MSKEAMKLGEELGRIRSILRVVTGFEDDDQQYVDDASDAIQKLIEALAEQPAQQEPVAWMDGYRNIYSLEEKAAGCPEATIALVPMANHKKTSGSPIKELNCICGAVWEGDELVHLPRPPAQQESVANYCKECLTYNGHHEGCSHHTSPPAQRKPLTDDPLQGAVDWLLEADGEYFCTATVQRTLRIGYNRAKRLCDTAKERAAHGIKENT